MYSLLERLHSIGNNFSSRQLIQLYRGPQLHRFFLYLLLQIKSQLNLKGKTLA